MSVLIATGVLAAYVLQPRPHPRRQARRFYEAAAMLVTFVLFGHWMEMKARRGTTDALRALFDLVPPTATVLRDGREIEVPTAEVVGRRPGRARPATRCRSTARSSTAHQHRRGLVTGESAAGRQGAGRRGDRRLDQGPARHLPRHQGRRGTALAQIVKLVETAQNSKAPGQRLADRAAAIPGHPGGRRGHRSPSSSGPVRRRRRSSLALTFAISAVVIACPDALGLATPTAVAVGTGSAPGTTS